MGQLVFRMEHHGATHSPDHISVFFPERGVLYGGCAVRHGDSLGNVREAKDYASWHAAMLRLQSYRPRIVVPGHEAGYDPALLANTVRLLERELATLPGE